jgi:hypothetical protein
MLAADKVPFVSFHFPVPGVGYVEKSGSGYRWTAQSYQLGL